jgi:Tol biopolymer transport system component
MIDTTMSHYRVTGKIGAGGMGEVYRAQDTRLNREVALKVLPDEFARDTERMARFRREAQLLASLNHPNIATIYGLEEQDGKFALAMELAEGEGLDERIGRGPVRLDEALAIALQIVEALEAAHDKGIIHRDLKPANIKVSGEGVVKVLDFGLAKALEGEASDADLAKSPTISMAATRAGIILGTAAYMSPEQAKGKRVDRRADVWSFGAVLYEMLTGEQAFAGETTTDVLAAVVRAEPEWDKLPETTPAAIRRLLQRCLVKDSRQRLQAIGDARIAIEEYRKDPAGTLLMSGMTATGAGSGLFLLAPQSRRWLQVATAAVLLVMLTLGYALWRATRPQPKPVARFSVMAPSELMQVSHPSVAISPDGSMLAMVTIAQGTSRIFLRKRNEYTATELPGTENALHPAFSPDNEWVIFMGGGFVKKVPVAGGPIVNIAEMSDGRGTVWLPDGSMVYSPGATFPLMRVAAPGTPPTPLTRLVPEKKERSHRWPTLLPGGKAVLFTVGTLASPDNYDDADIDAVVVKTGERKTILKGASMAMFAPGGYLVFGRTGSLFAVRFDPEKLEVTGNPVPVLNDVSGDSTTGAVHFSIAEDGTIAYLPGGEQGGMGLYRVMWVDRKGATEAIPIPDGVYIDPKLSPDGKKAALVLTKGANDVWIYDFTRKNLNRLTFDGGNITPVWSPDSKYVYYSGRDAATNKRRLWRKAADGGSEAELLATLESRALLGSVAPDGGTVYMDMPQPTAFADVLRLRLTKDAQPEPVLAEARYDRFGPEISPDGKYLAYISQESGAGEVFINALGPGGGKWQVSTNGGVEPRWSPDGKELFYRHNTQFLAVPVETKPGLSVGTARVLFEGVYNLRTDSGVSYSVSQDGKRFLMVRRASQGNAPTTVNVILNWQEDLKRTVK